MSPVPNAWANQMRVKLTSVPDRVFVLTGWAYSLILSFKDVAATLMQKNGNPLLKESYYESGADPGFFIFFFWGGGAKMYVSARTLRARNRTHFRQGFRARLRALEAIGLFFNALSCYLSLILKHSDRKFDWKNIVDPTFFFFFFFWGGGGAHHLDQPLWIIYFWVGPTPKLKWNPLQSLVVWITLWKWIPLFWAWISTYM